MSDTQERVQARIDELVASGAERGLQVAVYRDGELVVDAVAGVADPATGRPVTSDTPFFSFSIGKGVAATAVHVLAEHGVIDYDTPIAEVWPEFAAHGKSAITLRHALSQSAGVPGLPRDITIADLPNWDKMCAVVADETPWWEAGTKIGYHAITFGFIVGEFVRRVTGKKLSQVVREQVAAPLGVEDELMLAVPADQLDRLAVNEDAPVPQPDGGGQEWELPPDAPMFRIGPMDATSAAYSNRADVRQADIPAGGTTTARAVARMYAALLGPVDGVRLISPERLEKVTAVAASGEDQVFGFPSAWGLGYSLGQFMSNAHETRHVFGVGGVGGSHAYADRRTGTTFALTKNRLAQSFDTAEAVAAVVADAH
jgi:CubicO group peptidase (beta-lactamase class C family)